MINITEKLAVVATIDSVLSDNASTTSDWVDMGDGSRLAFYVLLGATDTTFDAKLQSATASDGTGAADITGKAITQLAGTDDNKQVILEIDADELPDGAPFCALVVTAGDGTTGVQVAAVGLLADLRYGPATNFNLASVAQIVKPT